MSQPAIVLAMQPSRTEHVLPDELLRRLSGFGRLLDSSRCSASTTSARGVCWPKPKS